MRPNLLVFDPYAFAAPLAAAVLGVRLVRHSLGPVPNPQVLELVGDAVSPIWREFGRDVPPAAGLYSGITLTICPASLDPAGSALPGGHPLRATPVPAAEPPPLPLPLRDGRRPLVYLTLGTFSNRCACWSRSGVTSILPRSAPRPRMRTTNATSTCWEDRVAPHQGVARALIMQLSVSRIPHLG